MPATKSAKKIAPPTWNQGTAGHKQHVQMPASSQGHLRSIIKSYEDDSQIPTCAMLQLYTHTSTPLVGYTHKHIGWVMKYSIISMAAVSSQYLHAWARMLCLAGHTQAAVSTKQLNRGNNRTIVATSKKSNKPLVNFFKPPLSLSPSLSIL